MEKEELERYIKTDGDYRSFPLYSLEIEKVIRKIEQENIILKNERDFLKDWVKDLLREELK